LGVFGIALSTVILPTLSAQYASGSEAAYRRTLDWALRLVFLIALPATLGLAVLAAPMLASIFQYEEFSKRDVLMASHSLMAYASGLLAFILIKVLSSGFFSRQDTKTPVKIAVLAMLSNIVLNLLLVQYLAHAGLALATSLSAFLNAGLLFLVLRRRGHYLAGPGWFLYLLKLGLALLIMCALLYWVTPPMAQWFVWGVYERLSQLAWCILIAAAGYFFTLWLLRVPIHKMTEQP